MARDFIIQTENTILTGIKVNYAPTITVGSQTYLATVPNDASSSYSPNIETEYTFVEPPFILRIPGVYSLKNTGQPYTVIVG